MPYFFEEKHILPLEVLLLLLISEQFGCRFRFAKGRCHGLKLLPPLPQLSILLFRDRSDVLLMSAIPLVLIFLEKAVLDN